MTQPTPEDFTPTFPRSVDNTMLVCFDSCPQKFFNEFCVRIARAGISPDLHAGGAFAHAMETTRYALYRDGLSLPEAIARAYIEFTKFWGLYEPPRSNPKTYIATFCAIVDYFREYPPFEDPLQPHYHPQTGLPSLEYTIAIPLPINHPQTGDPILYSGRFDMLAHDGPDGPLCVVDEKTTKSFYKNWASQWAMRGQFIGYVWATQQYNLDCHHYCVRGIAIQRTQYQHLQHGPVAIPDYHIKRWHTNMLEKVTRMVECWAAMSRKPDTNPHDSWPSSFGEACSDFAGCSYTGICTQPDQRRWYYDFERRTWDPLAKNPTAKSEQPLLDLAGMTLKQLGGP